MCFSFPEARTKRKAICSLPLPWGASSSFYLAGSSTEEQSIGVSGVGDGSGGGSAGGGEDREETASRLVMVMEV